MQKVYVLWHSHELKDDLGSHDELKMIGIFSTEHRAKAAIEQLKDQEGFRDYPLSCFEICEQGLDRIGWKDGFYVARWTE